eukprot:scaffold99848_cov19-Prasinocladus_malaysianus.AAC.1
MQHYMLAMQNLHRQPSCQSDCGRAVASDPDPRTVINILFATIDPGLIHPWGNILGTDKIAKNDERLNFMYEHTHTHAHTYKHFGCDRHDRSYEG